MMKKKVLMPLLMAGMMVVSAMSLNSCKKNQEQQSQSLDDVYYGMNIPVVEENIGDRDDPNQFEYQCPYCPIILHPGDVHWHAFGAGYEPDYITYEFPAGEPFDVDACLAGLSDRACPYSGCLEGNETAIQYLMNRYHVSRQTAIYMLLPRFHAHRIAYDLFGNDGGQINQWHVGGGTPYWPTPIIPIPEP